MPNKGTFGILGTGLAAFAAIFVASSAAYAGARHRPRKCAGAEVTLVFISPYGLVPLERLFHRYPQLAGRIGDWPSNRHALYRTPPTTFVAWRGPTESGPNNAGRDFARIVSLGPSVDGRYAFDPQPAVSCSSSGFLVTATLNYNENSDVSLRNSLWRPALEIVVFLLRPGVTVDVKWQVRNSKGVEVHHPPIIFPDSRYPITVSKTID